MTVPPHLQWTASEAAAINDFLNSPLGNKWLGQIISRKPSINLEGTEKAALSGAYAAGYESVFGVIHNLRQVYVDDSAGRKGIDPTKD